MVFSPIKGEEAGARPGPFSVRIKVRGGTEAVNMGSEATRCDGRIAVFHVIATPPGRLLLPVRSAGQVQEGGSAHGTRIDEVGVGRVGMSVW